MRCFTPPCDGAASEHRCGAWRLSFHHPIQETSKTPQYLRPHLATTPRKRLQTHPWMGCNNKKTKKKTRGDSYSGSGACRERFYSGVRFLFFFFIGSRQRMACKRCGCLFVFPAVCLGLCPCADKKQGCECEMIKELRPTSTTGWQCVGSVLEKSLTPAHTDLHWTIIWRQTNYKVFLQRRIFIRPEGDNMWLQENRKEK